MDAEPTVFVVDDDQGVRDALEMLLTSVQLPVKCYASGLQFLEGYDPAIPGCLLLDVRMPGMSGLEFQAKLAAEQIHIPIIFLTGYADVSMAVQAMDRGGVDFIQKPFRDQHVLDSVHEAIKRDARTRRRQAGRTVVAARLASLTAREREILDLVVTGLPSKTIAHKLGLSGKMVEVHRGRILRKMQASNAANLVSMDLAARTDASPVGA